MSSFASAAASSASKNAVVRFRRRAALLQANIGVLGQKLDLMEALRAHLGRERANQRFAEKCSVVGASVGQHFRHSTDHMENVANGLRRYDDGDDRVVAELHYDVRVRGGNDENDMDAAEERTRTIASVFRRELDETMRAAAASSSSMRSDRDDGTEIIPEMRVLACFLLSGDPSEGEFSLPSTIDRELGFAAHHAIHHLAMVKIISVHTLRLLQPGALPEGFGMAPSTIVFDHRQLEHRTRN